MQLIFPLKPAEELKAQKGAIKSEVENEDLKGPKTVVEKKTFDKK